MLVNKINSIGSLHTICVSLCKSTELITNTPKPDVSCRTIEQVGQTLFPAGNIVNVMGHRLENMLGK